MRERIARFMAGRHGNDQLNRFLSIVSLVLLVAAVILNGTKLSAICWLLALVSLAIVYMRMLSRNRYKRLEENERYLRACYKYKNKAKMLKERWVQRKEYKFFSCPACHTTLRVPKGKGKINIVCRKCGNSFQGKT